jgi:hypothetical protein
MNCLQCNTHFAPLSGNEIFCSQDCFIEHETRGWVYSDDRTLRSSHGAESFTKTDGSVMRLRLCDEFVAGRWEPFYSIDRGGK